LSGRLWLLIAAAVLVVAGFVTAGLLIPPSAPDQPSVAAAIYFTATTAQDTAYAAPDEFVEAMTAVANDHKSVMLGRIGGDGSVTVSTIDLTPRTSNGEILKVPARIDQAISDSIDALVAEMNRPTPTSSRALYAGLMQARIPNGVPLWLFSSGIDTASPDDMRALAWDTPVNDLAQGLNDAGAVPDLKDADVTFVMTAPSTTGGQIVRVNELQYSHSLWTGLLSNASAKSVTIIDMPQGEPASDQQVPVVPVPDLPTTPVKPQVTPDGGVTCTLGAVYFLNGSDEFVHEDTTRADLADCAAALSSATSVTVAGTVSYEGKFDANGKPLEPNYQQWLAQARATRVANLLVELGVPKQIITAVGYGGVSHQPYPQAPADPKNRSVAIHGTGINK